MRRPAMHVLDAHRSVPVEQDPRHERTRRHVEVGRCITGWRYARAADRRRPSCTFRSKGAKPSCRYPLTSSVRLQARLLDRFEERAEQRVRGGAAFEDERPGVSAERVVALGRQARLHPLEVRQAMRVAPALHPGGCRPAFVVQRVATLEDHPVDAAGAAQHLATCVVDPPAAHVGLGFGLVLPVVEPAPDREREGRRHLDEDVPAAVGTAGFQDEDAVGRVR